MEMALRPIIVAEDRYLRDIDCDNDDASRIMLMCCSKAVNRLVRDAQVVCVMWRRPPARYTYVSRVRGRESGQGGFHHLVRQLHGDDEDATCLAPARARTYVYVYTIDKHCVCISQSFFSSVCFFWCHWLFRLIGFSLALLAFANNST